MDYIGSEISHKIRSAIKAKLMELGAYVDEELPEYIMVMVANKRAKAQMDGDLQLFLGNNTAQFTSWLYQVLQKLQEVTVGNLDKKSGKTTSSSGLNDSSTTKRKSSVGSDSDSHRKEKRRKSSESKKSKKSELDKPKENKKDLDSAVKSLTKAGDSEKRSRSGSKEFVSSSRLETCDSLVSSSVDGRLNRKVSVKGKDKSEKLQDSDILRRNIGKTSLSNGSSKLDEKNYLSRLRAEALRSRDERMAALKLDEIDMLKHVVSGKQVTETKLLPSKTVYSQPARTKIILMHSDDEDDDEDFINIKADAEAEQLLKEELEPALETNLSTPEKASLSADSAAMSTKSPEGPALPPELPTIPLKDNLVQRRPLLKEAVLMVNPAPLPSVPVASVPFEHASFPAPSRLQRKRPAELEMNIVQPKLQIKEEPKKAENPVSIKDRLGVKKSLPVPATRKEVESRNVTRTGVRSGAGESNPKAVTLASKVSAVTTTADGATKQSKRASRSGGLLSRVVMLQNRSRPDARDRLFAKTEEEEEEYDPSNPAVGNVASIVRVKPRPKVPAALQANKNLILKAVAEAQRSVAKVPARTEHAKQWKRTNSGLVRRRENNVAVTLPNRHHSFEGTDDGLEEDIKPDSTRLVSSLDNLSNKIVIKVSSKTPTEDIPPDSSQDMPTLQNVHDMSDEEILQFHDEEGLGMEEPDTLSSGRSVYPPVGLASRMPCERNNNQQHQDQHFSNPQFLVTLDGLDPSMFGSRTSSLDEQANMKDDYDMDAVDNSESSESSPKKMKTPIVYKVESTEEPSEPSSLPKSLERCKYWPSCRLGATCNFHHPVSSCKSFPKCPFGDKCLYVHPFCKFNSSCTRRDCSFVHASPRPGLVGPPTPKITAVVKQSFTPVCKYFPKCSNAGCRFLHPKACRYGKFCSKPDCNYIHQDIPTVDKLKWTSPFKT